MGFEIEYTYHEKTEEGYNTEEVKSFSQKVGGAYETVEHTRLAGEIIKQLARRDVWITKVKINEFVKKEVKFRESKGGIIIGKKKYSLDAAVELECEDLETPAPVPVPVPVPDTAKALQDMIQPKVAQGSAIKVVYSPDPRQAVLVKSRGASLTEGKEYISIGEETDPRGLGRIFTVVDDAGKQHKLNEECFTLAGKGLVFERELGGFKAEGSNLNHGGTSDELMPDVRLTR